MVFTVKITTEASEERMIKDVDVGGTKLILESGKKEIEALEVEFSCRVPLVTEVKLYSTRYRKRNFDGHFVTLSKIIFFVTFESKDFSRARAFHY